MPLWTFSPKFDAEKLLSEAFFGIMRVFSSVRPKSVCNFPILYHLIFKPYLSSPLAPLQGEIDIHPRRLFCPKFDAKKLLFDAFFGIMHILITIIIGIDEIQTVCLQPGRLKMVYVFTCVVLVL